MQQPVNIIQLVKKAISSILKHSVWYKFFFFFDFMKRQGKNPKSQFKQNKADWDCIIKKKWFIYVHLKMKKIGTASLIFLG